MYPSKLIIEIHYTLIERAKRVPSQLALPFKVKLTPASAWNDCFALKIEAAPGEHETIREFLRPEIEETKRLRHQKIAALLKERRVHQENAQLKAQNQLLQEKLDAIADILLAAIKKELERQQSIRESIRRKYGFGAGAADPVRKQRRRSRFK